MSWQKNEYLMFKAKKRKKERKKGLRGCQQLKKGKEMITTI